jgi:transposase
VRPEPELNQLTDAEKTALIQRLEARIAELEARLEQLTRPPKTPDNSSKPPSQAAKPNRPAKPPKRRKGRPGRARELHPEPDCVIEGKLAQCPHCQAPFAAAAQDARHEYDRIELPPIKPRVTRVRLFGGTCACCGKRALAAAPDGLAPGSSFGKSIEALALYLHYAQAISFERLRALFSEVFGLSISEGALSKMLARSRKRLEDAAAPIAAAVRQSQVVCCDETSARVAGATWWEWVFATAAGVLHRIRPSRGKSVPGEVFGATKPAVWVSDMLGSQRGHGAEWQVCLAHLLRDAQYAIDCGDLGFSAALRRVLLSAIAIGRRRERLRDGTLRQYAAALERKLDRAMAVAPVGEAGRKLRARIARIRGYLFVFVTNRDVPATNNVSERALRPSVIFRKVTNGFRSEWGAAVYAAFRSVVSTAKLRGASVLAAIQAALQGPVLAGG